MALNADNFKTMVAGANAFHHYNTPDTIAVVSASGYFNAITHRLKKWDVIAVVGVTGGTATIDMAMVTSATGAAVVTTSTLEGTPAT